MITWRYKTLLFDQTRLILILSGFMTIECFCWPTVLLHEYTVNEQLSW